MSLTSTTELAKFMHIEYERAAKKKGWNTQDSCRNKKFEDLPLENRLTMMKVAEAVILRFRDAIIDQRDFENFKEWYNSRHPNLITGGDVKWKLDQLAKRREKI